MHVDGEKLHFTLAKSVAELLQSTFVAQKEYSDHMSGEYDHFKKCVPQENLRVGVVGVVHLIMDQSTHPHLSRS